MSINDNIANLFRGKFTIHQNLINKLIGEAIEKSEAVKKIEISIAGGYIKAVAVIQAGNGADVIIKLTLSLSSFEFNKTNRFMEFLLQEPAMISLQGVNIRARLEAEIDRDPSNNGKAPEGLAAVFQYLEVKEDKIKVDFNKIPGFGQAMQGKLGFLLKGFEIAGLELAEETLVISPSIKLF